MFPSFLFWPGRCGSAAAPDYFHYIYARNFPTNLHVLPARTPLSNASARTTSALNTSPDFTSATFNFPCSLHLHFHYVYTFRFIYALRWFLLGECYILWGSGKGGRRFYVTLFLCDRTDLCLVPAKFYCDQIILNWDVDEKSENMCYFLYNAHE